MSGTLEGLILPPDYKSALDLRQTVTAIKQIKDYFERRLAGELNLVGFPPRFL